MFPNPFWNKSQNQKHHWRVLKPKLVIFYKNRKSYFAQESDFIRLTFYLHNFYHTMKPWDLFNFTADEDEDAEMRYYGDCSSSTSKSQIRQINQLRGWKNRVTCSQNLVWLAWKHTVDQNKFYNAGGRYSDSCNMHSWKYGPARCCYSKGNGPCMWKAFEKLAGKEYI